MRTPREGAASVEKPLRKYVVNVVISPPMYEIVMGINEVRYETLTIYGTSKKDAMRRAGLE